VTSGKNRRLIVRFYQHDNHRDVYNEKPSREEILTTTEEQALSSLS